MHRLFICVAVFVFSVYSANNPETAALNQLTGSGMEEGGAIALTNALRGELTRTGMFAMMERSQINEILAEQGFQLSGACADNECVVEIGQLLAVRSMFMGHVGRVGETFSVSVRQIDVESGRVIKDVTVNRRGDIDDVLTEVMPSVARQLAGLEKTVTKKRSRVWLLVAGAVVAGAAVPVVFYLTRQSESEGSNMIEVEW